MASVKQRGDKWRVRWLEPGGVHRSRTFTRKVDADNWAIKVSHQLLEGSYVVPTKVTVKQWGEQWREGKLHRDSTKAQVESHFRNHVYPALGDMPLASVRPSHVQQMVNGLVGKLGPATITTVYAYTAGMFKDAARDREVVASPCIGIDLPKFEHQVSEVLTAEEVLKAADTIHPPYRAAVIIGAGAGLRPAEVLGLEVRHVDFLRGTISVEQQLYTPNAGQPRVVDLKTPQSRRVVPIPSFVTNGIAEHLSRAERREGFVFLSTRGNPVRRNRYVTSFRRSGAPGWSTPHDLRHFYASVLISQGLDVKTIQRRLGHKSATTTLDVYGHLFGDHEDATRDAVEAVLAPTPAKWLRGRGRLP